MRKIFAALFLAGTLTFGAPPLFAEGPDELASWFKNEEVPADEGIQSLRSRGASGLAKLFQEYDALHGSLKTAGERRALEKWMDRWIDSVCTQRFCRFSRLYWYTSYSDALAQARKEGKPILRLRLLGDLTAERSCANSRFFKALVYPNAAVAPLLRNNYVLLWESERPVPQVTVELGGGRVLRTTVTGNSVHYVFDSQGRVVDAIPGLFDPFTFAEILKRDAKFTQESANLSESEFLPALYNFHNESLKQLDSEWEKILSTGKGKKTKTPSRREIERQESGSSPDASAASRRAITKNIAQLPVLKTIRAESDDPLDSLNRQDLWKALAERYLGSQIADSQSRALIEVGSSRVDLQACKLEYSIVSPK